METPPEKLFNLPKRTVVFIDWANVYGWTEGLGWEVNPRRLFEYFKTYPEVIEQRLYHGTESNKPRSVEFQVEVARIGFIPVSKEVKWVPVSLEKSYFKELIRSLFDVLDNTKTTNSEISNKLYDLSQKVKNLPRISIGSANATFNLSNAEQLKEIYDLVDDIDQIIKKLNIDIDALQKTLAQPVLRRKCDLDCEIVMHMMDTMDDYDGVILMSGDGDYKGIIEYLLNAKKKAIVIHPFGRRGKELNELLKRPKNKPFFFPVDRLENEIKNLPADFSAGRDVTNLADSSIEVKAAGCE
jgi:uncharacterized LabA/DUF88 family protein